MTNQNPTVIVLENVLANSYSLMLKTQNYHWNVSGPNFKPLHELFQLQYEDLFAVVDEIAERIRALGSKVEGNYEAFSKLTNAKKPDENLSDKQMLEDLVIDNKSIVETLKKGITISQENGDEVTAGMLTNRAQIHEKAIWMIESSK